MRARSTTRPGSGRRPIGSKSNSAKQSKRRPPTPFARESARPAGRALTRTRRYVFANGAVTGVLVLAQSHLSIYTWPAFGWRTSTSSPTATFEASSCCGRSASGSTQNA
ncbi:MAG: hypothetical protein E6G33_16180 [Actinobacteria bacterium]|nr:MAG: hypothetical protein E6G33_16180 [Actinomycetota bacterium]